jgi:hypothetical protein
VAYTFCWVRFPNVRWLLAMVFASVSFGTGECEVADTPLIVIVDDDVSIREAPQASMRSLAEDLLPHLHAALHGEDGAGATP